MDLESSVWSRFPFQCAQCGKCCDFQAAAHRCLLTLSDVRRWWKNGFLLGLALVFPAHSIDRFSALAIPTKIEVVSSGNLEWIRPLDEGGQYKSAWPKIRQTLDAFLAAQGESLQASNECVFLGQHARCLIHKLRPGACRLFPHTQQNRAWVHDPALTPEEEGLGMCPPEAFKAGSPIPADNPLVLADCRKAIAAAYAQEFLEIAQIEAILVDLWQEVLPLI